MIDNNEPRMDGSSVTTADYDRLQNEHQEKTSKTVSEFAGEELVISYPSGDEPVIDGASIRVPPGEVTALVGPNGSGKSTLLKGLADQLALDAGTVHLDGTTVHELGTKDLARKLGLLSQENVSPDSISVEKLVEHGRYPHRGFFDSLTNADRTAIARAISLSGIEHLREREVGSLSGMLPIAASLSEQGIAIGTVLAFVIGGAGVSIPNLILLNKLFKRRLLLVYASTVVTIGIVVGSVFNALLV